MHGIRPLFRSTPLNKNLRVFGMDTETYHGHPLSLQIAGAGEIYFSYVSPDDVFEKFWGWTKERMVYNGVNLCYVHNLGFDLRVLFNKWHKEMYRQFSEINFKIGSVVVSMLYGKINKATLQDEGYKLDLLDSRAFTLASLDGSLKMFGVSAVKLDTPEDLGNLDFKSLSADDPRKIKFEIYSKNDAEAERLLGEKILSFHRDFGVSPSISLPSFAAKVFRKRFLEGQTVPFPSMEIVKASEQSFHGGKNGYYEKGPKVFEDLYEVDINSAYPTAMASFPGLTDGAYAEVEDFRPGFLGVYCLSGRVDVCKYPVIFDHAFESVRGDFDGLWHTGYETELAMRKDSGVTIKNIRGYIWVPDKGSVNPFKAFVDYFYGRKEKTPKSDPYYHFYKIVLNALFGKLIAASELRSFEDGSARDQLKEMGVNFPDTMRLDERWDPVLQKSVSIVRLWKAGGLYNPFIATQITGYARKYLYELETKYEAVHSATDSIKTTRAVSHVSGLGGLKLECFGRCYIFRNKLYLHFAKDFSNCKHNEKPITYPAKMFTKNKKGELIYVAHPKANQPFVDKDGQHLCKYALHAFKGPLWVLFENRQSLIDGADLDYDYVHVIGLREGLKRNETPCDFVIRSEKLRLKEDNNGEFTGDSINDREEIRF